MPSNADMNFDLPRALTDYLGRLDAFIDAEIRPLEAADDNIRFFDHRREWARTDFEHGGLPRPEWEALLRQAKKLADKDPERWMRVEWAEEPTRTFETEITVLVRNGKGVLAQVASAVSAAQADITHIDMGEDRAAETTELRLLITVRDRLHLADALRTIRRCAAVLRVWRVKP